MPLVPPASEPSESGGFAVPAAAPSAPLVKLVCFELAHYRRLRAVRLDLQDKTTVLVGANDSGKSSLLLAVQKFLSHATGRKGQGEGFSAYDIAADGWAPIIDLGRAWEQVQAADVDDAALQAERLRQIGQLLGVMPTLDVWLEAREGAWHLVRDLIPNLEWSGGRVGVRLRLEPVSTVEDLDGLIKAYQNARRRIEPASTDRTSDGAARQAWPTDLFDYMKKKASKLFSRVVAYKLDQALLTDPVVTGEAQPQALGEKARRLDDPYPLRHLVLVDFIAAQRGLGGEEAAAGGAAAGRKIGGLLSAQLVSYASRLMGHDEAFADELDAKRHGVVGAALAKAHGFLDVAINSVLAERIAEVRELGYPGLGDVRDIVLRAEVDPTEALKHRSAVQYRSVGAQAESTHLPEHAIGLGYQNLLSLAFALMCFRDDRLRASNPAGERTAPAAPPVVHLVLLEEPEAHLHVQVQRTFILRAHARLVPKEHPELCTQVVVSTHSSHLAHAVDFAHLRYLRRMPRDSGQPLPTSVVVSLAGVFGDGATADEDTLGFVQRYLRIQHNDLLFADAVVMVEGTAERMLVPAFIERDHEPLQRRFLSLLDVGGSHAHRLRPLLERLGLPTLLLTDLDPAETERRPDKRGVQRTFHTRQPTTKGPGLISTNFSIVNLLGISGIEALVALADERKLVTFPNGSEARLRVAYQIPAIDGDPAASSLEDALVLESREWFAALPDPVHGTLKKVRETLESADSPEALAESLHEMMGKSNFDKGAFALDIFMRVDKAHGGFRLACPRYIREGLTWLSDQLATRDLTMGGGPT
jgi:hypothetical protein